MNSAHIQQYIVILFCLFLIATLHSCFDQSQFNSGSQQIETSDSFPDKESKIDSALLLKYSKGIRAILEDSKGNIWFGSHSQGACLFDGKKLSYYTTADGLSDNQVRSIFEDSDGMIWFECGIGLSTYDGKKIKTYTNKSYLFKHNWRSEKDDLWFKGDDELINFNRFERDFGVYRYDGTALYYHAFPITVEESELWYYSVSTPFIKGKNGMIWIGTYGAIFGYDGVDFTIINNKSLGLNDTTGYLHVRSIFEDSKGRLWIGNNGIGVLLKDRDSTINFSKAQHLISKNSLLNGGYRSPPQSMEHVFAIGEDRFGNIWFGDRDTGAWKFDGQSMTNYTKEDGLTSPFIWQIYNTKNGELWFAMDDGSVLNFNGKTFERVF